MATRDKVTWTSGSFAISCHQGISATVTGYVSSDGLWGIEKKKRRVWKLTHIPTGMSVGSYPSRSMAVDVAERITPLANWQRVKQIKRLKNLKEITRIVREHKK